MIALPLKQFKRKAPSGSPSTRGPKGAEHRVDILVPNAGESHQMAIVHSIDALSSVLELISSFLDDAGDKVSAPRTRGGPASSQSYIVEARNWIIELRDALDQLEEDIRDGYLDKEDIRMDTEGVEGLDETLDRIPNLDDSDPAPPDTCTNKMLTFWLEEAKRRGRELVNICIKSVDYTEALKNFMAMKNFITP